MLLVHRNFSQRSKTIVTFKSIYWNGMEFKKKKIITAKVLVKIRH